MNHQGRPHLNKNLYGEGGAQEKGSASDQKPSRQETQRQRAQDKTGIIGSMYPHLVKGMAPGGVGEEPLPPGRREPPEERLRRILRRRKMMKVIQMRTLYQ